MLTLWLAAACTTPQVAPSPSVAPSMASASPTPATPTPEPTVEVVFPMGSGETPPNLAFSVGAGVSDADVADVREGTAIVSRFLASRLDGDRTRPATARIRVGTGSEEHCCFADPGGFDIITSQHFWTMPSAPSPETWTVDTERKELAAHEYVHVWQHEVGGAGCVRSARWMSEGMAEWIAYHSLMAPGLVTEDRIRVFMERQLRQARYLPLSDLVGSFPFDAEPYAVSYLAVDLLARAKGPLALRDWCQRVGSGQEWTAAFQAVFGEPVGDFYRRLEQFRAEYAR